jgi:hypothetical protein
VVIDWANAARGAGPADVALIWLVMTAAEIPAGRAQAVVDRVHLALEAIDVSRHPMGVDRHVRDARVHRHEVSAPWVFMPPAPHASPRGEPQAQLPENANWLCRTEIARKCWLRAHPSFSARSS